MVFTVWGPFSVFLLSFSTATVTKNFWDYKASESKVSISSKGSTKTSGSIGSRYPSYIHAEPLQNGSVFQQLETQSQKS